MSYYIYRFKCKSFYKLITLTKGERRMKKILLVATCTTLFFATAGVRAGVEGMPAKPVAKKSHKAEFVHKTVKDKYIKCMACGLLHKKDKPCRTCVKPVSTERKTTKETREVKRSEKKEKAPKKEKVKKEKKPKKEKTCKAKKACKCAPGCKCGENCNCTPENKCSPNCPCV
jgi:hypothetical protein